MTSGGDSGGLRRRFCCSIVVGDRLLAKVLGITTQSFACNVTFLLLVTRITPSPGERSEGPNKRCDCNSNGHRDGDREGERKQRKDAADKASRHRSHQDHSGNRR